MVDIPKFNPVVKMPDHDCVIPYVVKQYHGSSTGIVVGRDKRRIHVVFMASGTLHLTKSPIDNFIQDYEVYQYDIIKAAQVYLKHNGINGMTDAVRQVLSNIIHQSQGVVDMATAAKSKSKTAPTKSKSKATPAAKAAPEKTKPTAKAAPEKTDVKITPTPQAVPPAPKIKHAPKGAAVKTEKVAKPEKAKKVKSDSGANGSTKRSISQTAKITLLATENPKRADAGRRFALYKTGMTVAEYVKLAGPKGSADISWDSRQGFIKLD